MNAPTSTAPGSVQRAQRLRWTADRLTEWRRRAGDHITEDDLKHFGPMGVWETIRGFARDGERLAGWSPDLDARDAAFVAWVLDAVRLIGKAWFRFEARGVENVPAEGPALLVGNHNGGVMPADTLLTVQALWDRFGPDRAVNLLGHDLLAYDPVGRKLAARFGILRATPESAAAALRAGRLVLVYPGSDLDSWRPWRDRHRVQLAGRKGFLRIALQEGVPVVPVVSTGTHEQFVVLSTGRTIARRLGLKRKLRSEAFPIVFALPWGITSGFFPYLPLPAQTTISFGKPISWRRLDTAEAADPQRLTACYEEVHSAMQAMLSELARGRIPVVGALDRALPGSLLEVLRRGVRPA